MARAKEIQRVAKVHREPVIAVLEADSPVGEYNRIADEVLRLLRIARVAFTQAGAVAIFSLYCYISSLSSRSAMLSL